MSEEEFEQSGIAGIGRYLFATENATYALMYTTDVQYDRNNAEQKEEWNAMEDMISVAAAPLIDPNRNSIVIEITNSTSNFGASDFLVLSVLRNVDGSILIREDLAITWGDDSVIAERYKNIRLVLEETLTITPEENMVTYTEVNGQNRYAIVIRAYPEGCSLYVYWDGSAWEVCFSAIGCANTSESDEQ